MYPPSHLPLRGLTLYIDPHLLLVRVSKGLAHLEIELCSSISDLLHERDRGLYGEDPPWIQDPSREDPLVDSRPPHGDEPYLVFFPLLFMYLVDLVCLIV